MKTDHYKSAIESDTAVKTAVDLNIDKDELARIKIEEEKVNLFVDVYEASSFKKSFTM
jgi:hypothetical protein